MADLPNTGILIPEESGGVPAFNTFLATIDALRMAVIRSHSNTPPSTNRNHGYRWGILNNPDNPSAYLGHNVEASIWYQGWLFANQSLGQGPTQSISGNPGLGWWGNNGTTTAGGWQDKFTVS